MYMYITLKYSKGLKKVSCTLCDEKFHCKSLMETHILAVHEQKFTCTQCNGIFKNERNLKGHVESVHEKRKVKLRTCTDCNKSFTLSQWVRHINLVHPTHWIGKSTIHSHEL